MSTTQDSGRVLSVVRNPEMLSKYIVVIGIDFGTSRSGFTYAYLTDGEVWNYIGWNAKYQYPKTPSQVIYDRDNKIHWGWDARKMYAELRQKNALKHATILKKFKLALLTDNLIVEDDVVNFSAINVISDYLREMKNKAIGFVFAKGTAIPFNKVLWVLTMPAGWGDRQKTLMRDIAQKAGLISRAEADQDRLILMPEPEAAVVYCQNKLSDSVERLRSYGGSFMVIDAGGGTVDVASYKVGYNKKLAQLASSEADTCGSEFINDALLERLVEIFPSTLLNLAKSRIDIYYSLLDNLEQFKCNYNPGDDYTLSLTLPSDFYKYMTHHADGVKQMEKLANKQNGEDTRLIFRHDELDKLFSPICRKAVDVAHKIAGQSLKSLSNQKFDYIFLVGGFSNFIYLQNYMKKELSRYIDSEDRIMIPRAPEEAVVAGATAYGLDPTIIHSRRSKLTYGADCLRAFEEGVDPIIKRKWNPHTNSYWCEGRFNIFVKAQQEVEVDKPVISVYTLYEPYQSDVTIRFFSTKDSDVRYIDDPGVSRYEENVSISVPGHGVNRQVQVTMFFGKNEIEVVVKELVTNTEKKTRIRFSDTYS